VTLTEFKNTLNNPSPPRVSVLLQSLWHDARGDWEQAHNLAQDVNTPEGSWVHAYLHRKEGDQSNAHYWYGRAKRIMPAGSLEQEWEQIVIELNGR
jgi:hypothetical protein